MEGNYSRSRVQIFAGLHSALLVFTCAEVVLHLVSLFAPSNRTASWLSPFFSEVADLGVGTAVGFLYRPRTPSPFHVDDAADALRVAAGGIISGTASESAAQQDEELGRLLSALAARERAASGVSASGWEEDPQGGAAMSAADGERRAAEGRLPVLVENPCSYDAHGRQIVSVSVGMPQPKPEDEAPGGSRQGALLWESDGGAHLELAVVRDPVLGASRRLTQTQPPERDVSADGRADGS